MYKTSKKHSHDDIDFHADLAEIKSAIANTAGDLRDHTARILYDSVDTLKDKSEKVRESIGDYTSEKPVTSLLCAFAIGVVIGHWFIRRQ